MTKQPPNPSEETVSKNKSAIEDDKKSPINKKLTVGFTLFWNAYPKKRGKGNVEKIWTALKPDEGLLGLMLAKIDQAKQTADWIDKRGKYIPYPATWLNAKGWEDEYPSPQKERLPL